jgi:hypothetical protein
LTTDLFSAVYEEFDSELSAIEGVLAAIPSTDGGRTSRAARVVGNNAATLLLAAVFEEYVRQQVKAAFGELRSSISDINGFPEKLPATVWRRGLQRLAASFDEVGKAPATIKGKVGQTLAFCLDKVHSADVSYALMANDTQMRPDELARMFKQLGIRDFVRILASTEIVKTGFVCCTSQEAEAHFRRWLNDFILQRNAVAHSITFGSSVTDEKLSKDIGLFRIVGQAIASVLKQHCDEQREKKAKVESA